MKKHIESTPELGKKFYQNFHDKGKVCMLNLLKFNEKADYTNFEFLNPGEEISGKNAYELYMKYALQEFKKTGSKLVFYGNAKDYLIGPESENWDAVLIVEHKSAQALIDYSQNKNYIKYLGHRVAAVKDSRLLPMLENKQFS